MRFLTPSFQEKQENQNLCILPTWNYSSLHGTIPPDVSTMETASIVTGSLPHIPVKVCEFPLLSIYVIIPPGGT